MRFKKRSVYLFLSLFLLFLSPSQRGWSVELSVQKQAADYFSLGGYFYTDFQALLEQKKASFSNSAFEYLAQVEFAPRWTGLLEIELKRKAGLFNQTTSQRHFGDQVFEADLERGWIDYESSLSRTIRLGWFFVPFGQRNREHFFPIIPEIHFPMFLEENLIARRVHGVSLRSEEVGGFLDYEIYSGIADASEDPLSQVNVFTGGAKFVFNLPFFDQSKLGFNYQTTSREGETRTHVFGGEIFLEINAWNFLFEWLADTKYNGALFYILTYQISNKHLLFFHGDFLNKNWKKQDDTDMAHISLGWNYLIRGNMRIKVMLGRNVFFFHRIDAFGKLRDFWNVGSQIAFSF